MLQILSDCEVFHIKPSQTIIGYLSAQIAYVKSESLTEYEDYYRVKCDSLKPCIPVPKITKNLQRLFLGYKGRNMEEKRL
jgi:hypothetical protein